MHVRAEGEVGRRAFLGLAVAAGASAAAGAISGCTASPREPGQPASPQSRQPAAAVRKKPVPEAALPGDEHWVIRNPGAEHEIEGYAGAASVLPGQRVPLFVSSHAKWFTVTA